MTLPIFVGNKAKRRNSERVFQENKAYQIFRKTYVCVSGGKKCSFFGKFGVLCFLETLVLRFALLLYYRRFIKLKIWRTAPFTSINFSRSPVNKIIINMVPSIIVFKFKFVRFNAARNERLCKVVRNTSVEK